jgi:hypothetical protein
MREWEALLPHERVVKPKGNGITQKYYTKRLLTGYINAVQKARLRYPQPWILQEDNDPSYGNGPRALRGLATCLKEANWIDYITHPLQLPDLNPIEGVWNILKQRVRKRRWQSLDVLKEVLQDEWSKITMEEVCARISEMPQRFNHLIKSGGGPIKSELW